jgi:hypothetical protein
MYLEHLGGRSVLAWGLSNGSKNAGNLSRIELRTAERMFAREIIPKAQTAFSWGRRPVGRKFYHNSDLIIFCA